jgi:DNA-directed RNA polymerase specialized sigma24 family protein
MKYVNGNSVNEIALELGLSEKAAESLLTRARKAFKEGFNTLWDFEPGLEL